MRMMLAGLALLIIGAGAAHAQLEIPAPFVESGVDPQTYVDRYNNEPTYKAWFDDNYSEYSSIYEAVGLEEPMGIADFVEETQDPQYYVDRYNNEPAYKAWFDENYSQYSSIYEAVGLEEPKEEPEPAEPEPVQTDPDESRDFGECGEGTGLVGGECVPVDNSRGGGCLIATAAYGTELAPQVQLLREIRDGTVSGTHSGAAFMTGFNQIYYVFSPTIADWQRESPIFQDMVRAFITPMVSTLHIMTLSDGSEMQVLGLGTVVIALNLAMYVGAPAIAVFKAKKHVRLARVK